MIQVKTLPCGARLVTEKLPEFRSASIGIWVGAGAVKEASDRNGISHFIEHMCFKGTEKRNFLQLAKEAGVVMTGAGELVEVQITAEKKPFTRSQLNELLDLAQVGIEELISLQKDALGKDLVWRVGRIG